MIVNRGENAIFFWWIRICKDPPQGGYFLIWAIYVCATAKGMVFVWLWCEKGIDFGHFGLHQHWEICSPSQMFMQMEPTADLHVVIIWLQLPEFLSVFSVF